MSKQRRSKGAGFVRERGDHGRQLVVKIDGRQYVRSVHTRTLREAEKMLAGFIVEIQSGAFAKAKIEQAKALAAPTFAAVAAQFIAEVREHRGRDKISTTHTYENCLSRLGQSLGAMRVSEITKPDLRKALATISQTSAASSVKLVRSVANVFFNWLIERGIVDKSPVATLKTMRLPEAAHPTKKRGALTRAEIGAIIGAIKHDHVRLWAEVLAATGCRASEAAALRWNRIDLIGGQVRIDSALKEHGFIGTPKSKNGTRTVPIGSALLLAFRRSYAEREALCRSLGLPFEPDDAVFCVDVAEAPKVPRSTSSLATKFKIAAREVGLPHVSPHWLRHSYTTALVEAGVSVFDVAALIGDSPAQVLATYGHAARDLTTAAAFGDALIAPHAQREQNVVNFAGRVSDR